MLTVLSLFSGIGGIDLGLQRAGCVVVGQCEIDPFCRAVLAKHWPGVPRWEDVRDVTGQSVTERCGAVDLVAGGFPCQDVSCAGRGAGLSGERSGLWYDMLRVVREVRPLWVLAENVPALRTRGADDVLGGLEAEGYTCWPVVVGAWAVGAPHKRDRVWIVARANRDTVREQRGRAGGDWTASAVVAGGGEALAHPRRPRLEERRDGPGGAGKELPLPAGGGGHRWPSRPGEHQHEWEAPRLVHPDGRGGEGWSAPGQQAEAGPSAGPAAVADARATQSRVGVAAHGLPRRLDGFARRSALKALGNAVVPQVVEAIGRCIVAAHTEELRQTA